MAIRLFFRNLFSGAVLLTCLSLLSAHASEQLVTQMPRAFPKENPNKIEVIEFFSYGCGHCKDFHPALMKWVASQSADVSFRRVPVAWNRQWSGLSRLYYTLELLGELKRLDNAVFEALHKERRNDLVTERGATNWYVGKGGNEQKFRAAYNSFGIASKVSQAENLAQQMEIQSVPALVVEGQYRIQGEFEQMLKAADQLIERARKK
ncbi:MAG: thiol:disulfide interchange protein DsbA/DsbL [Zoogloeaceae bacterium]|jgi:thiol:disulfide interchange protein DsbA|nr:thiol:disulfide interchange protein DsbA/DsbL [Zoogloeaceae bacterium]